MRTELIKVDPEIVGGAKIRVVEYNINNYRLHQVLEQVARLLPFCLECDSNNTASKARPRDVRKIIAQWQIVKDEFSFSMAHNDYPNGQYEQAFKVCIIDQKEIQAIRNVKMKRVVSEIFNIVQVMLSVDSAKTQGFIAAEDASDITLGFTLVDDCIARWLGNGADAENVGVFAPAYEELGEMVPDVDLDYSLTLEPSKMMPNPALADVLDTPVSK
jgi:hypothetical protein